VSSISNLLRSAATTFLTAFIALVPLSAVLTKDFSWVQSAAVSAALTALRTLIAYIDPENGSFGLGSPVATAELDEPQPDAPTEG